MINIEELFYLLKLNSISAQERIEVHWSRWFRDNIYVEKFAGSLYSFLSVKSNVSLEQSKL